MIPHSSQDKAQLPGKKQMVYLPDDETPVAWGEGSMVCKALAAVMRTQAPQSQALQPHLQAQSSHDEMGDGDGRIPGSLWEG